MNRKAMQQLAWATARRIGKPLDGYPDWIDITEHALRAEGRPDDLVGMFCTEYLSVQVFRKIFFPPDGYECAERCIKVLGVRRHDTAPIKSWDLLQEVKNVLAGPEKTAVEIYPPQSDLVDDANMRWIWVLPDDASLGFGWERGGGFL